MRESYDLGSLPIITRKLGELCVSFHMITKYFSNYLKSFSYISISMHILYKIKMSQIQLGPTAKLFQYLN